MQVFKEKRVSEFLVLRCKKAGSLNATCFNNIIFQIYDSIYASKSAIRSESGV